MLWGAKNKKTLLLTGILLLIAVATVFLLLLRPHSEDATTSATEVINFTTDTPDETKPDDTFAWKGNANDPKKIIIPSLNIDNFIQNVGVDQNKQIAAPNNVHVAGWFVDGARPGDRGLSIIDGHLNGRQSDGVFLNLDKAETGMEFSVKFGDGSTRKFVIKNVQTVNLDQAANVLFSQDPNIKSQLNLITCGGNFDADARLYDKRVIVIATKADT